MSLALSTVFVYAWFYHSAALLKILFLSWNVLYTFGRKIPKLKLENLFPAVNFPWIHIKYHSHTEYVISYKSIRMTSN
jgi:hypothetical protein